MLHATAPDLDSIGRIIDFGDLKRLVGGWLEEQWDHGFILFKEDEEAIEAVRSIPGQKLYLLDTNPTAENMADHLLRAISPKLLADTGVQVIRVVLWETENCFAEACL
jgi:6-pyruvoyltetrahydropterin/6-carboxytetrahydropterin synthase